jgi:hypothetical protein
MCEQQKFPLHAGEFLFVDKIFIPAIMEAIPMKFGRPAKGDKTQRGIAKVGYFCGSWKRPFLFITNFSFH